MNAELVPQILVAGVGNTWMKDDAFGSEVVKGLLETDLPEGVTVLDFGTGGLDLAYELMRGYNAMILVDVSRQGGDPGTLYVMDPDPAEIKVIGDGEVVNPHGMDPHTVLRFVKTVGGWPGRVVVVACEPAVVEEHGLGMSPEVEAAVERGVKLVQDTVEELRAEGFKAAEEEAAGGKAEAKAKARPRADARALDLLRDRRDRDQARPRAARDRRGRPARPPAAGRPGLARLLLRHRLARDAVRGGGASDRARRLVASLPRVLVRVGSRAAADGDARGVRDGRARRPCRRSAAPPAASRARS